MQLLGKQCLIELNRENREWGGGRSLSLSQFVSICKQCFSSVSVSVHILNFAIYNSEKTYMYIHNS